MIFKPKLKKYRIIKQSDEYYIEEYSGGLLFPFWYSWKALGWTSLIGTFHINYYNSLDSARLEKSDMEHKAFIEYRHYMKEYNKSWSVKEIIE